MAQGARETIAPAGLGVVGVLGFVLGLASLACWILEIVAAFKKEEKPLLGILSIVLCGLGGLVIGWIHAKKWNIQKLMLIWTIVLAVTIVLQIIAGVVVGGAAAAAAAAEMQTN